MWVSAQTGFLESSLPCYLEVGKGGTGGREEQEGGEVPAPLPSGEAAPWLRALRRLPTGSLGDGALVSPGRPRGSWLISRHHFWLPCLPHLPSLPHWYLLPSRPPELNPLPQICFWRIPKQDTISPCPWHEVPPTCPPRFSWPEPCTARAPPRHARWRPTWDNRVLRLPRRLPAASQGSVGLMGALSCLGWEPGHSRLLTLNSSAWQAQPSLIRSLPLPN